MNMHNALIACAIATGAGVVLQARADATADPVLASFDRALNHPVTEASAPTGRDVQEDILYLLVNQTLQSTEPALAWEAVHPATAPDADKPHGGL